MKKFYAIIAAALMSVSVFTAKADVPAAPSDAVLGYTPGNVGVCIYVPAEIACNDIVFAGTYNNWAKGEGTVEDAKNCQKFEAVEGYTGWYYVEVTDATESPEGKPVMLNADGNFNWAYQIHATTVLQGDVTVTPRDDEIDLKNYSKDKVNVYTVEEWKQNPCDAVYHYYTVTVVNNLGCGGFAVPFIIGSFNNWQFQRMQLDEAKSTEEEAACYALTFKAAEDEEYQIVCGLIDAGTGEIAEGGNPGWNDASYLNENVDGDWGRINGGANFVLGSEENVVYDWRDLEKFQWGRCMAKVEHTYTITAKLPTVDAPAQVEVRGGWRDADEEQGIKSSWEEGAIMTPGNTPGLWTVTIDAYEGCQFKFCSHAMGWDKQIQVYDSEGDTWKNADNQKFGSDEAVAIDFSDPDSYQWTPGEEQGIEDIVLTEKAQKVMVDGVLYIIRDNKMFNVQGAQVR